MLRQRGLDPTDWYVDSVISNEWDAPSGGGNKVKMYQTKFTAKRKRKGGIQAARPDGWKPKRSTPWVPFPGGKELTVALPDQHAPYHDLAVHATVLQWLEEHRPQKGILLGDLLDFADISRHRFDPAWSASTQTCLDSAYSVLVDYLNASPDTDWTLIEGNHEARLRNTMIDYARDLYGLRPGALATEEPEDPALSISHLLRLDELGITYKGSNSTYEHTKIPLSKHLAAIHGDIAVKGSGSSVLKALDQYGHSIIQGHCHRQAIVYKTIYDLQGHPGVMLGAEAGCLCQLEGGLGYTVNANWQQGFLSVTTFTDQKFHVEPAMFVNGALYYRDERYG
jgi:hypothetical protein